MKSTRQSFDGRNKLSTLRRVRKEILSKAWDIQFEFSKNDKGEFAFVTEHFNGEDVKGTKK